MDNIWLSYGAGTLIDDCEAAWTSDKGAAVTCSAATGAGDFKVGSKSSKLACTEAGTGLLAHYNHATNVNISSYLAVGFWIRSSVTLAAGILQIVIDQDDNASSPEETINLPGLTANVWKYVIVAMASPTAMTSVDSWGLKGTAQITADIYIDSIYALAAKNFSALSVKGLDRPEDLVFWPPIAETLLDGTLYEDYTGFRRRMTLDLVPLTSTTDFNWLKAWFYEEERYVHNDYEGLIRVSHEDPNAFVLDWSGGFELTKKPMLVVLERAIRTADPTSWSY